SNGNGRRRRFFLRWMVRMRLAVCAMRSDCAAKQEKSYNRQYGHYDHGNGNAPASDGRFTGLERRKPFDLLRGSIAKRVHGHEKFLEILFRVGGGALQIHQRIG